MKIGIIVAMEKELRLLIPLIDNRHIAEAGGYTLHVGRIGRHEVALTKCGIGKVNAALCADALIREFKPALVVNSGVAGGADPSMRVLTLLCATGVAYHDVWCGPGTEWGEASGCPRVIPADTAVCRKMQALFAEDVRFREGLICSGDLFVSRADEVDLIKSRFPLALAVDMESGAIAQTCWMRHVPFAVVRVISDTPGQAENISQYENFWSDAPHETFDALRRLLSNL